MLDKKWLLANLEYAREALARRGAIPALDALCAADDARRALIQEVEALRNQRKMASEAIGKAKKAGEDTRAAQAEVRALGERISVLEERLGAVEADLDAVMLTIPNLPLDEVPDGVDASANVEVYRWGEPLGDEGWRKPHWDVGEALGILDLERAAKVAGARFVFMRGLGARLELALARWMMHEHAARGYEEILPPYLVRADALRGTGQLPKFASDLFRLDNGEHYLIPTAEVPVTNLFAGEILEAADLPRRFVAFSPCFRAEAGAAGRDTRGIIRVHQFHKVELVRFEAPEAARDALEVMTRDAARLLELLGLEHRIVRLCAGDLGFAAAMTYDIEVWLPGAQRWLEISSCSTFGDFQARRANLRYRPMPGAKPVYLHTLNGSGLAVGRTVVALLERYQNRDGSVTVPEVLRDWVKADKIT